MPRWSCTECEHEFEVETAEEAIKRAAQHQHDHHGGPEAITPEIEAAIRGALA